MSFDFPAILLLLTLFTGVVWLVDIIFVAHKNRKGQGDAVKKKPWFIDYCRAFFPVFLLVFLVRSFIIQPYHVPTGSLKPTVMPGDYILVNQYAYGLRFPVWMTKFFPVSKPKVGQIALFHWPVNNKATFVKRVIGVPGDHISYINNVLYVNGKQAKQKFLGYATDNDGRGDPTWRVAVYQEDLDGVKHKIYICPQTSTTCPGVKTHNFYNLVVPKGEYFMMGDNRDNSDDSRDWGFVPEKNLIGKGFLIWFSWNPEAKSWKDKIRWHRIGTVI